MKLAEYQRAVLRASLAIEDDHPDLHALEAPERYKLYRGMIRNRLREMAAVAFKGCREATGSGAFDACFDRFLWSSPPASPLIRDVIAAFGEFAQRDATLLSAAPAFVPDMLRFEEAKWRVAYVPSPPRRVGEEGVRELDFEGVPVWNQALLSLRLQHAVHVSGGDAFADGQLDLLVYRPAGIDDVRWYVADPFFAALQRRSSGSDESLAELVRNVAEAEGTMLDQDLLETLASSLTLALTRGVLIGVRDA